MGGLSVRSGAASALGGGPLFAACSTPGSGLLTCSGTRPPAGGCGPDTLPRNLRLWNSQQRNFWLKEAGHTDFQMFTARGGQPTFYKGLGLGALRGGLYPRCSTAWLQQKRSPGQYTHSCCSVQPTPLQTQALPCDHGLHRPIAHIGEGNGTHSSTLAWKVPWTEEPGGLQSMGSQKSQTGLSD